jgi:HNH endonuclease
MALALTEYSRSFVQTVKERLLKYSTPEPNTGCWLWTGYQMQGRLRYGVLHSDGKVRKAHRLSYETFVGPIPSGKIIMHRCDTPECINPQHLSVGTNMENLHDCLNKNRNKQMVKRTHCKHGHEFTSENTVFYPRKNRNTPDKHCLECRKIRNLK